MKTGQYNVHGFARVNVNSDTSYLKTIADNIFLQLENFKGDGNQDSDLSILIGKFEPNLTGTQILDDKFWVKENYVYTEGKRKFARWKMELRFEGDQVTCRIDTNLAGAVTKPHFFAEFLIQYVLLQKGISVIHAAALEKNGHVLLFPGSSGGGKTTICMSLIEEGYTFLGDNYTILHQGDAYAYPSPLNVFSYNLVPGIRRNLNQKQLLDLRIRLLIYKLSGGYIKIFKKINPSDVVEQLGVKGKIHAVSFLTPSNRNIVEFRSINTDVALKRLNNNMNLEWINNLPLMEASIYANNNQFQDYWLNSLSALEKNLCNVDSFHEILVPEKYSANSRIEVMKHIRLLVKDI